MRETEKIVELEFKEGDKTEKRNYKIKKMDALAGSWLLKFCTQKILPLFNVIKGVFGNLGEDVTEEDIPKVSEGRTEEILELLPKALETLTEEELINFEIKCLKTVEAWYPAGYQPVINGKTFGDPYIEYDVGAMLRLVYEVLVFNLGSFFGEGSLISLLNLLSSSQSNA